MNFAFEIDFEFEFVNENSRGKYKKHIYPKFCCARINCEMVIILNVNCDKSGTFQQKKKSFTNVRKTEKNPFSQDLSVHFQSALHTGVTD